MRACPLGQPDCTSRLSSGAGGLNSGLSVRRNEGAQVTASNPLSAWGRYKLRLKRQQLRWRSFRSRHALERQDHHVIPKDGVLLFSVMRNEATRLPFFLEFYRRAGVRHFIFVDNDSDDGSAEILAEQPDCSVWRTEASYRQSRFGLDWITWLQMRYGHNRWCLLADVDELLVYAQDDTSDLTALTRKLEIAGRRGFGALMLDLYSKEPVGATQYHAGDDPRQVLTHFDAGPYRSARQEPKGNLWVQGGMRERVFFADAQARSPTLNKIPLIKWHRAYAWVNSCHALLPRPLNDIYDGPGGGSPSGALLHMKFLPEIVSKSETERARGQHFHSPEIFESYYRAIEANPVLWYASSKRYRGPDQLAELGLISSGDWMSVR